MLVWWRIRGFVEESAEKNVEAGVTDGLVLVGTATLYISRRHPLAWWMGNHRDRYIHAQVSRLPHRSTFSAPFLEDLLAHRSCSPIIPTCSVVLPGSQDARRYLTLTRQVSVGTIGRDMTQVIPVKWGAIPQFGLIRFIKCSRHAINRPDSTIQLLSRANWCL